MGNTLRMEAERIRTLPLVWYLALAAVLLGAVAAAFPTTLVPPGALTAEKTRTVISGASAGSLVPFVGLPVLFLGLAAVLEDSRYRLATTLFVAQPRRTTLVLARLAVLAAIAVPVCLAQMLISTGASLALGRSPEFGVLPSIALPYLVSIVLFAWVGAALGWLTSTAAVPVGLVLVDMLLLEPLARVVAEAYSDDLEIWARRLPFTAAGDALALEPFAVVLAVGYAAALVFAASVVVARRDY